jgi:hypothetical protein
LAGGPSPARSPAAWPPPSPASLARASGVRFPLGAPWPPGGPPRPPVRLFQKAGL